MHAVGLLALALLALARTQTGVLPLQHEENVSSAEQLSVYRPATQVAPDVVDKLLNTVTLSPSPYSSRGSRVLVYCYPFEDEELLTKCLKGVQEFSGTGLIVPLMSELQWRKPKQYYAKVAQLKRELRALSESMELVGIAYENPNWELIEAIITEMPDVFDGVLIEWVGEGACIWSVAAPSAAQLSAIHRFAGPVYYFFRQQDCDADLLTALTHNAYYNPNEKVSAEDLRVTEGEFPKFLLPVFGCFGGEEGSCYKSHRNYTSSACSAAQLYAWSPLDMIGSLVMHFRNETCVGLGDQVLYNVV